jgi:kanamycin kinase
LEVTVDGSSVPIPGRHSLDDVPVPGVVIEFAAGRSVELVWRNETGGLSFRIEDRFLKWNPPSTGIDLVRERLRLDWLAGRHPGPRVLEWGQDGGGQWLITAAVPGGMAIGSPWTTRTGEAVRAIAAGLRALHAVPMDDFPAEWTAQSWVGQIPESLGPRPEVPDPVLVHGDACAPNTLISAAGEWTGNVDFGDLAVGDRWADLSIASMSLDWNFGKGHQAEFYRAYGIEPEPERIDYYRRLWHLAS